MFNKTWIWGFIIAFALNLLIFFIIPFLSTINPAALSRVHPDFKPIALTTYRPEQPISHPQKTRTPKPDLPKKIARKSFSQRKVSSPIKPDITNLTSILSEKQFLFCSKLNTDFEISPPELPESLPKAPGNLSGPVGFELSQLDQPPKIISKVKPIYPFIARRRNITGKVVVRFLVDEHGYVRKITIEQASPRGIFEQSVIAALKKWRFRPGRYQGKPVPAWIQLPIQFSLTQ
ncbi:energy transducer TonB [Desulfovulcanus sp.]